MSIAVYLESVGECVKTIQRLVADRKKAGDYDDEADRVLERELQSPQLLPDRSGALLSTENAEVHRRIEAVHECLLRFGNCAYSWFSVPELTDAQQKLWWAREQPSAFVKLPNPGKTSPPTARSRVHPGPEQSPREKLIGSAEICVAIGVKPDRCRHVKALNEQFAGPIRTQSKGKRPIADKADLLNWWNEIESRQADRANQQEGRLRAGDGHAYGAKAIVAPEIGGSVKPRRKDRRR